MNKYFTWQEASAKMGRRIRTKVYFADVPAGTEGVVCNWYPMGDRRKQEAGVEINWRRWIGDSLKDGFSKDEYQDYLEEI